VSCYPFAPTGLSVPSHLAMVSAELIAAVLHQRPSQVLYSH
jgi:hypothetical protein